MEFYISILRYLQETVRIKRLESGNKQQWLLYRHNARPHFVVTVQQFLAHNEVTTAPYHSIYIYHTSANVYFYSELKRTLEG